MDETATITASPRKKTRGQQLAEKAIPPMLCTAYNITEMIGELVQLGIEEEREACAKIADYWNSDAGRSPLHGEALVHGYKMAGKAIADGIRMRSKA